MALLSLLIMRNTTMRGEVSPFIMELPLYHMPGAKSLALHLWDKAKHFIEKAFTIILISCVIIWFLSNFGWDWRYVGENGMDESILASLGKLIQPIFTPLGFGAQLNKNGWVFAVAAITGLIAKEDVIATFGALAACLGVTLAASGDGVAEVGAMISATSITTPALIAFIAFNMLTIPCFAAVAAAKGEIGKGKFRWTLLFWIVTSFVVSSIVYCVGSMLATWSVWAIATSIAWVVVGVLATLGIALYDKKMNAKEKAKKAIKR